VGVLRGALAGSMQRCRRGMGSQQMTEVRGKIVRSLRGEGGGGRSMRNGENEGERR